ncbi:probable serine/threonine-protein kinase At1g54610 [Impatiens glandulifera]|uniref:probable serine/threonine-protein kinase At1g54610 n=1 Tax=Impatiens glandulifera TaxID=253017 RepID=UPI001FB081E5|nr:probable serine/threonine-protein kinase At1g54610 [Impatiens glandulifera]
MGCVLGTRSGKNDRRTRRDLKRRPGQPSALTKKSRRQSDVGRNVDNAAAAAADTTSSGINSARERRYTSDFSGPEFGLKPIQGWPSWLCDVAGDAIKDWPPRRANTFEKLDKIGQGTYSNVYKARDLITGKIVALKKVRFDSSEPETVKFMAREILVLRKLDHPNVIKLEGLVTSRMSSSIYLVFEYMEHDLTGLTSVQKVKFSESQVKCFVKQLLSGLEHCHNNGVLHRDIKGSNLLIDNNGILKIADFGLASFYDPNLNQPMTSRVVTLWYRPPELLLGATSYNVGVDLWSAGCILAELLSGKPILPGRTEVEQLHKIFKLCGSPSEEYWRKSRLPNATLFKPQQPYKRCLAKTFENFTPSSLLLIETLLSIDPSDRGSASSALNSEFFTTEPQACEPSSLPKYPPSKEIDAKLRDEEARRKRDISGKSHVVSDGIRRSKTRERSNHHRAFPAPDDEENIDSRRRRSLEDGKSKSEKFPPPHEDAAVNTTSSSFGSTIFGSKSLKVGEKSTTLSTALSGRRKMKKSKSFVSSSSGCFVHSFIPTAVGIQMDWRLRRKRSRR